MRRRPEPGPISRRAAAACRQNAAMWPAASRLLPAEETRQGAPPVFEDFAELSGYWQTVREAAENVLLGKSVEPSFVSTSETALSDQSGRVIPFRLSAFLSSWNVRSSCAALASFCFL